MILREREKYILYFTSERRIKKSHLLIVHPEKVNNYGKQFKIFNISFIFFYNIIVFLFALWRIILFCTKIKDINIVFTGYRF